jgi:hypothetical protein
MGKSHGNPRAAFLTDTKVSSSFSPREFFLSIKEKLILKGISRDEYNPLAVFLAHTGASHPGFSPREFPPVKKLGMLKKDYFINSLKRRNLPFVAS